MWLNSERKDETEKQESIHKTSVEIHLSLDELPIGIYKTTTDGKILYANRALVDLCGCDSLEELQKYTTNDFYLAPDLRFLQTTQFVTNDLVVDEYEFVRRDGEIIWVRDFGKKVIDRNGTTYFEGSIEDITERKLSDEKIRESETKLRDLVETMEQGLALHQIILSDDDEPIDYIFLDVNSSFERLTGLDRKDIIGKRVLNVLPNTESYWIEQYGDVAINGETIKFTNYSKELDKYFEVVAYSPRKLQFAVLIMDVTEKILVENALRENELKLRTLINSIPDIICLKDGDGRWIEANDYVLKLIGLSSSEFYNKTDYEIANLSPYYRQFVDSEVETDKYAWDCGNTTRNDIVIPTDLGEKVFDIIKVPIFNDRNEKLGLVVVGRDITEKKMLEIALKKSENLYKTLIDTSPDCITVSSNLGKLIYVSPQAKQLYGLSSVEEAIGKHMLDFISVEEVAKAKKQIHELLGGKRYVRNEFMLRRVDGTEFLGEVSSAILRDEKGETFGLISITRDITERKKAEQALKNSEFHYRIISELITDYVYLAKLLPNGKVITEWVLGGFEKMTGLELNDLDNLFDNFISIVLKDDLDYFNSVHLPRLLQLNDVEAEYRIVDKSGNIKWICDTIKPFKRDEEPDVLYQIGAVRNITERKKYESALLESSKKLKIINDQKDRFFSIIAHDLKSPLSSFLGLTKMFAEQLQEMTLAEIQDYTTTMLKSAGNIFELLENLLEWSKMQRGRRSFAPEWSSLNYLIDYNIDFFANAYFQKNIKLESFLNSEMRVFADVQMLNTIFRNLLSNALKFTERGGYVCVAADVIDNNTVISIMDNGIGMDKHTISKLFDIGSKVSRIGTEDEPSSGLGLLLCKEFVEMHNGSIWLESEVGKGTTFFFALPIP